MNDNLISKNKNLFDDKNNDIINSSYENNVKNNDNFAQFCLRCRKQMYHVIENESNEIAIKELKTKDHKNIILDGKIIQLKIILLLNVYIQIIIL